MKPSSINNGDECEFGKHMWKEKSRITNIETGVVKITYKCQLCHDYREAQQGGLADSTLPKAHNNHVGKLDEIHKHKWRAYNMPDGTVVCDGCNTAADANKLILEAWAEGYAQALRDANVTVKFTGKRLKEAK